MSSVNACTRVQLDAAMDAIWADLEARYNTIEDVKARLFLELWPEPVEMPASAHDVLTSHAGDSGAESDESTASKKGRKPGKMSEEAKAKMVAKRAATIAAKKAAAAPVEVVVVVPEPVAEKPLKIKVPKEAKVKMSKEERSAAAKARYAALSDEGKAAIRERLVNAKAAAKAAKAAAV
jgi:hypothetical protein